MKRSRGKAITVIAGLGALILAAALAGSYRRDIYNWLYPPPPENRPFIWDGPDWSELNKKILQGPGGPHVDIDKVILDMEERPLEDSDQAESKAEPKDKEK